jgi:hypothetical protein
VAVGVEKQENLASRPSGADVHLSRPPRLSHDYDIGLRMCQCDSLVGATAIDDDYFSAAVAHRRERRQRGYDFRRFVQARDDYR